MSDPQLRTSQRFASCRLDNYLGESPAKQSPKGTVVLRIVRATKRTLSARLPRKWLRFLIVFDNDLRRKPLGRKGMREFD